MDDPKVTNGLVNSAHYGPVGDVARTIASYCEGDVRANVYNAAFKVITDLSAERDGKQMTPQVIRRELKRHGDAMGVEVVPHGLRKNAVISLLEAGCSVYEVMAITGQSQNIVAEYAEGRNQRKLAGGAVLKLENSRAKRDKSAWRGGMSSI